MRGKTAILNGTIMTMDQRNPSAEALLIIDDRIKRVGSNREIQKLADEGTIIIDLKGKTVLPGFVDSHTHFAQLGLNFARLDLSKSASLAQTLEMTREYVKQAPPDNAVVAVNWDQSRWPEKRFPLRDELDKISPRNPLIARRICGHVAVANSRALKAIGKRDGVDGETGLLLEDVALNLENVFPPSLEELVNGIELASQRAHRLGITSVHDMTRPRSLRAYQVAHRRGMLNIRAQIHLGEACLDKIIDVGIGSGLGDEWLRLGGIKIFADGSLGARTAALSAPYADEPDNVGILTHSQNELNHMVEKAHKADLQVAIHAIGDRAIEQALKAYEKALKGEKNRLRHRIEHFEVPTESQLKMMGDMNLVAAMQPNFVCQWGEPGEMYHSILGEERWQGNNPFRTLSEHGVTIAFGSDCMPLSPLYGIYCAVHHPITHQRITLQEAIRMYTFNGAYASFEEGRKGSISEGKLADLVVLSEDALTQRTDGEVEMTFLGGEMVYRNRR